jgi:hypothetical protein
VEGMIPAAILQNRQFSMMNFSFIFSVGRGHLNQGVIAPGNHWI